MPATQSKSKTKKPFQEDAGFAGSVARFWQRSYAADYLGFAVLVVLYILILLFLEPFHRMFSLDNISIQYPHALVQRVSVFWNLAYSIGLPLMIIVLWAAVLQPGTHKVHVTVLGLAISVILATVLTDIAKNAIGRPRPDLLARCKPKKDTPLHELVTIDVCTEVDHHTLHDGWRSFPSGHSSLAFSGLGFFAFFLAGQMHVFRPRTDLARVLLALAPIVGAALIAISRLEDYRHDVYDVTIGSLLGILIAYFSYRRYFPGLRTHRCDEPYPSRSDLASRSGASKLKDEEARVHGRRSYSTRGDASGEDVPLRESSRERE